MADKYASIWVSYSSISDFQKCPRSYYLKNIWRHPESGKKVQLMSPPLALGSTVHSVLEQLSNLPVDKRFTVSLQERLDLEWKKVSGKLGGFLTPEAEQAYKKRASEMMTRVSTNPGPLKNLAVKIKEDLPHYFLSEEDNIILCGKIDWLEYFPETDSLHIIDFKTSKNPEDGASLQLSIYHLLVANCQKRTVDRASYWYLDFSDTLQDKELTPLDESYEQVLKLAKQIKIARQLERFKCPNGDAGCYACKPYEAIVKGEAEHVGVNEYMNDVFILKDSSLTDDGEDSIIL